MTKRSGVTITQEAHNALRALTALAGGVAEHPVSMSAALVAVLPVARAHQDELKAALAAGTEDTQ